MNWYLISEFEINIQIIKFVELVLCLNISSKHLRFPEALFLCFNGRNSISKFYHDQAANQDTKSILFLFLRNFFFIINSSCLIVPSLTVFYLAHLIKKYSVAFVNKLVSNRAFTISWQMLELWLNFTINLKINLKLNSNL